MSAAGHVHYRQAEANLTAAAEVEGEPLDALLGIGHALLALTAAVAELDDGTGPAEAPRGISAHHDRWAETVGQP